MVASLALKGAGPWFIPTTNRVDFIPSPDGRVIYISSKAGLVERWDQETQTFLPPLTQPGGSRSMDLSPDGRYLVVPGVVADPGNSGDVGVTYWENPFQADNEPVRQEVRWNPSNGGGFGLNRVTIAPDRTVFVWSDASFAPVRRVSLITKGLLDTGLPPETFFNPDSRLVRNSSATAVALASPGGLFIWDHDGARLKQLSTNSFLFLNPLLSDDGRYLLSWRSSGTFDQSLTSVDLSNSATTTQSPFYYIKSTPALDARRSWLWTSVASRLEAYDLDGITRQVLSLPTNILAGGINNEGVGIIRPAYGRRSLWLGTKAGILGVPLAEPEPFTLLSAHDFGRTNQVLLRFNNRLNPITASLKDNYQVAPTAVISKVRVLVAEGHVELDVSEPVDTVTVGAVTDEYDRHLNGAVKVEVSHRPVRPDGEGTVVSGYQDSFLGTTLSSEWAERGAGTTISSTPVYFYLQNGVLRVPASSGLRDLSSRYLLFERSGYNRTNQEILVRARLGGFRISQHNGRVLGAAAGVDYRPDLDPKQSNYLGVNAGIYGIPSFKTNPVYGLDLDYKYQLTQIPQFSVGTSFVASLDQWYWIRLRHRPDLGLNQPDAFMKLWLDDGRTPEPNDWLTFDYTDSPDGIRAGYAGLAGGWNPTLSAPFREVDYIAIIASGLPEMVLKTDGFRTPDLGIAPVSAPALEGESVTLSANAIGEGELSYRWYYDGLLVPNASFSRLTIGPMNSGRSGSYWLVVSNAFGAVTSPPVRVTVIGRQLFSDDGDGNQSGAWANGTRSILFAARNFRIPPTGESLRLNLIGDESSEWKVAIADVAVGGNWSGVDPIPELGRWGVRSTAQGTLYQTSFSTVGYGYTVAFAMQEYPSLTGGPVFDNRFGDLRGPVPDPSGSVYRVRFLIPPGSADGDIEFGFGATNELSYWGIGGLSISGIPNSLGIVRFRDRAINMPENRGQLEIVLERLGNRESMATVQLESRPGPESKLSELPGWVGETLTVRFAPGETNQVLRFPIPDNSKPDPLRRVQFLITEVAESAAPGDVLECWVQLLDDESGIRDLRAPALVEESRGQFGLSFLSSGYSPEPFRSSIRPAVEGEGGESLLISGWPYIRINDDESPGSDRILRLTMQDRLTAGPSESTEILVLDDDLPDRPAAGPNGPIYSVTQLANDRLLLSGGFNRWSGQPRPGMAVLRNDGELISEIPQWPGIRLPATPELLFPNGGFLVSSNSSLTGVLKIRPDLSVDTEFDATDVDGWTPRASDPQNRIYLSRMDVSRVSTLRRCFSNGKIDPGFSAATFRGGISSVAIETNGSLLVAGDYDEVNSEPQKALSRLDSNGKLLREYRPELDPFFYSTTRLFSLTDGSVVVAVFNQDILVSPNGKLATPFNLDGRSSYGEYPITRSLGGNFYGTSFRDRQLFRFNREGSRLPFVNQPVSFVGGLNAITELDDGSILAAGSLTDLNGQKVRNLARINSAGRLAPWPGYELPPRLKPAQTNILVAAGRPLGLTFPIPAGDWRYLWTKDGAPLMAQTGPALNLTNSALENAGRYQLLLRGPNGFTDSVPIDVRVIAAETIPSLSPVRSESAGIGYRFQVPKGAAYRLQKSSDLVEWTPADVGISTGSDGVLEFFPPTGTDQQYFRILLE